MTSKLKVTIYLLLVFLVLLDIFLATLCLFSPETWFRLFHDAPYIDPQGLLRRTGAVWAAFTLFQLIALLKWQRQPYWLPLVAGIRLTEVFSDWVYLYMAESTTWFGKIGLFIAPLTNVLFACILLWGYRRTTKS